MKKLHAFSTLILFAFTLHHTIAISFHRFIIGTDHWTKHRYLVNGKADLPPYYAKVNKEFFTHDPMSEPEETEKAVGARFYSVRNLPPYIANNIRLGLIVENDDCIMHALENGQLIANAINPKSPKAAILSPIEYDINARNYLLIAGKKGDFIQMQSTN